MNYEELLIEADSHQLLVKEKRLLANDGRINGKRIAIRSDISTIREKACVLAEELGHHYTTTGNILDMTDVQNRKQEHQARLWAYDRQIGLQGLINAFEHGCKTQYEIAEYLDVTEKFLSEAIKCYTAKFGILVTVDQYIIHFTPAFAILKLEL